jgi:hypothetical protein
MKLSFVSALAFTMAGNATASTMFLRSSKQALANPEQPASGEVGLQIHGVAQDTLSEECHKIITDAFSAAYQQVYGDDSITGTIKPDSEQVFRESSNDGTKASNNLGDYWSLGYFYWYGVYWVSETFDWSDPTTKRLSQTSPPQS